MKFPKVSHAFLACALLLMCNLGWASFNQPPDCSGAEPSIGVLWPPDHKFVDIQVLGVTDPDGGPITIVIDSILQDEPVDGLADGKTVPDGIGVGTSTAEVRAERSGQGDGRLYEIGFTASDSYGDSCTGTVYVSVPHDQSGAPAVLGDTFSNSTIIP